MSLSRARRVWLPAFVAVALAVVNTGLLALAQEAEGQATVASHTATHRKSISGMAFVGRESTTTRAHDSGCVYRTAGTGPLVTSLQLPNGAVIKDVDYYYYATANGSVLR